jgi:hypothetical protein
MNMMMQIVVSWRGVPQHLLSKISSFGKEN